MVRPRRADETGEEGFEQASNCDRRCRCRGRFLDGWIRERESMWEGSVVEHLERGKGREEGLAGKPDQSVSAGEESGPLSKPNANCSAAQCCVWICQSGLMQLVV